MSEATLDEVEVSERTATTSKRFSERQFLIVSALLAALPFYWAAIRDARNGFYPTLDVGATILRARDVFSAHPPLYGMWSSGSSWAGHEIHFPGALQLYVLAVPSQFLGTTWGPLLAMATLNAFWIILAGWLIYRRLGLVGAQIGFLTIAVFLWSIGSENLIDPRPMEMVTIPFLCFLFAVWAVTAEDIDAIPALALVANYLFLGHLVLTVQIPVLGLCALASVILWWRARRKANDVAARRKLRRRLIQAGIISVIMWLPSLYQEVRGNPGNLSLLVRASSRHRDPVGSYAAAYNATIRLIADPMFWFRGRFEDAAFPQHIFTLRATDVIAGIVVTAVLTGLGIAAYRRTDRVALSAIIVSVVAIVISIETAYQAPAGWGFPMQYLRSLWVVAAFVWFAVALNVFRMLKNTTSKQIAKVAGGLAVVFCVLALSFADFGSAVDMENAQFARRFVAKSVPLLEHRGKVYVEPGPDFGSQRFFTSLMIGLDIAGVHYCVDPKAAEQFGDSHSCQAQANVGVYIAAGEDPDPPGAKLLVRSPLMNQHDIDRLNAASATVRQWLRSRRSITPNRKVVDALNAHDGKNYQAFIAPLHPKDGDLLSLLNRPQFWIMVGMQDQYEKNKAYSHPAFDEPTFPTKAFVDYYKLNQESERVGSIWLYEIWDRSHDSAQSTTRATSNSR